MSGGDIVLVDTGPLVALFDPSDAGHELCRKELGRLDGRILVTSLAVLTEATYLLAFSSQAQSSLLTFVGAGANQDPSAGEIHPQVQLTNSFAFGFGPRTEFLRRRQVP